MGTSDRREEEETRTTLCAPRSRVPVAPFRDTSSEMSQQQAYGFRPVTPDAAAGALKVRETPPTPLSVVPSGGDEGLSSPSSPPSADQLPDGCRTPSSVVFDSFAPGPDDLNMAPKRNSRSGKAFRALSTADIWGSLGKSRVFRVLHFDDDNDDDDVDDDVDGNDNDSDNGREKATAGRREEVEFLQFVYEDLLRAILSNQADDCIVKNGDIASPKTPRCLNAWINGLEDTCPNAPIKPRNQRAVASATFGSLCRKLEF
ncbi:uncharacterized protein LOC116254954 [Nymphaea colorata]|uniref:uncharacterized protein LOC116254954 n=1 Tax=Nymphaea colorata TaxID=210225 RepID=UPI00129D5808|nr:uncharacterized protein LOC116254954 [Nymphaea colorata]